VAVGEVWARGREVGSCQLLDWQESHEISDVQGVRLMSRALASVGEGQANGSNSGQR
jgi:hypothetical protein